MSQQVWLVAFTHCDKMLTSPGTVRGWLSEVARRRALDLHGSPWNCRNDYVDSEVLAELVTDPGSSIEATAILSEMLERLPERYHEIVRLRAEQYEIHEIAETHGVPWSTANSRWERACEVAVDCGING